MEQSFTFQEIPSNVSGLQALPEAALDTPFKTAALTILSLCCFEQNQEAMFEMLEFLNGPDNLSVYTRQFLKDRLTGKAYKAFSFFEGAGQQNGYTPTRPYRITISDNPNSYGEENYATLYVKSAGADSPRPLKLRKKPSTGQWFVTDIQCLADIRIPASEDPWA